jgi:hypothetical protein
MTAGNCMREHVQYALENSINFEKGAAVGQTPAIGKGTIFIKYCTFLEAQRGPGFLFAILYFGITVVILLP